MKNVILDKVYDPSSFEDRVYAKNRANGDFKPIADNQAPYFSIVMPPPNVTGVLHMGHALNITLQDILVRYNRMSGKRTLWVPGTDHAGIATQHVVETQLQKEGKRRVDMTREEFLKRTNKVKDQHHDIIVSQIAKMGASCDWQHERFTLDEGLSKAVRECSVTLYERVLIYKGKYLVNYCPHCMTALSDDEVDHKNVDSFLWTIKYEFIDHSGYAVVATTRPETLFGDTAIAVNPDDTRYKSIVGKKVKVPFTDRVIPIIADSFVDKEFGSGMVKITPAHDPHDRDCGLRHNLDVINILNPDGTLNDNVNKYYIGLSVEDARKKIDEDLEKSGLLLKKEPISHEVGHCYRCGTIIEPYLSSQWFVKMRSMADKALEALEKKEIVFYPKKWESTYSHWMRNIKDWCISRQLWWGHRIPVWYCQDCGEMMVSRDDITKCTKCSSANVKQDEDVLDTWFSSWLWPFSTLGWPDSNSLDLKKFFPTTTLVTAYDIIFFWVSRMIMASLEFTGKAPFHDIYITSLVRDKQGRKMSKSLGNGIDPLEVVKLYGSDAMKFTLAFQASQGQDIFIDIDSFKFGSKFANKVWNASRYILMNLDGKEFVEKQYIYLNDFDNWIYYRLNQVVKATNKAYSEYKINEVASLLYDFFWNDFCDWYIEFSKNGLYSKDKREQNKTISILLDLLEKSLRLLHPLIPLVTEEIYSFLPNKTSKTLIGAKYPEYLQAQYDMDEIRNVELLQNIIKTIRALRIDLGFSQSEKLNAVTIIDFDNSIDFVLNNTNLILPLANLEGLEIIEKKETGFIYGAGNGFLVGLSAPKDFNPLDKIKQLEAEAVEYRKQKALCDSKLENENFRSKAKKEAVDKEISKQNEFREKIEKLEMVINVLKTFKEK